jgi:hypothetical protein
MKIKNYRQFNEEISKEKLQTLATAGLIGLGGYGAYQMYQKEGSGELVKEISIGDLNFKKYDIYVNGKYFESYISDDGVISTHHSYTKDSGDDEKTINRYLINLPPNTTEFYYDKKFFDVPMASLKEFKKSLKVELKDLKIKSKTEEYTIYYTGFFSTLDYIIVNHKPLSNSKELELEKRIGIYGSYKLNNDIYIISPKYIGGGKFGGGGASSNW